MTPFCCNCKTRKMRLQQYISLLLFLTCLGRTVLGSGIVNGETVPASAMQYMVSVQNLFGHVCGGFLVSEDFVLTAAHCNNDQPKSVVLGSHNLMNANRIYIEKIFMHPSYENIALGNDLMLLKLSMKVVEGNGVQIIKLADANMMVQEHDVCQVAGWGAEYSGGRNVEALKATNVSIIDINTCKHAWGGLPDNVICAGGSTTTKGFCQGDSGGPLVCGDKAVGIVSFNRNRNCNYTDEVPNVYVDVRKYFPWIHGIIS